MGLYDAGVTPLIGVLGGMKAWMDKAIAAGDLAKMGGARLADVEAPSMPDSERSFAELKARCDKTIAFLEGLDPAAVDAAADRTIDLSFPNGMAFSFTGAELVTFWTLPNFYFHATTAYGLLRAAGVELGKGDFLSHIGRFARTPPKAG